MAAQGEMEVTFGQQRRPSITDDLFGDHDKGAGLGPTSANQNAYDFLN